MTFVQHCTPAALPCSSTSLTLIAPHYSCTHLRGEALPATSSKLAFLTRPRKNPPHQKYKLLQTRVHAGQVSYGCIRDAPKGHIWANVPVSRVLEGSPWDWKLTGGSISVSKSCLLYLLPVCVVGLLLLQQWTVALQRSFPCCSRSQHYTRRRSQSHSILR